MCGFFLDLTELLHFLKRFYRKEGLKWYDRILGMCTFAFDFAIIKKTSVCLIGSLYVVCV